MASGHPPSGDAGQSQAVAHLDQEGAARGTGHVALARHLELARHLVDHHVTDPARRRRLAQHAEAWSIPSDRLLADVALVIGLALCASAADTAAPDDVTTPEVAEHLVPGSEPALFATVPLELPDTAAELNRLRLMSLSPTPGSALQWIRTLHAGREVVEAVKPTV